MSGSDRKILITGIGFAGAAGNGVASLAGRLRDGNSALRLFFEEERPIPLLQVGAFLGGDWNWQQTDGAQGLGHHALDRAKKLLRGADTSLQADACALWEAKGSAAIAPDRLGLVVGGSNLAHPMLYDEMARFQRNPSYINPRIGFHALDTHVAATLAALAQARGPALNVAAAAASGAVAAVTALDLIRSGRCDACLAVGAMQRLSPMDWNALAMLGALNITAEIPIPFGGEGKGFAPGEGAACVLLERADHAQRRGVAGLAELAGGAFVSGSDPLPHPCRDDESKVMALALADAGMNPRQIDLITAHATGTPKGDEAEAGAIADLLGDELGRVWVAAPKAVTGHCLTAAGLVGLIATVLMLVENRVYPLPRLSNSPSPPAAFRLAVGAAVKARLRCAISNAFGFGGFNASLVLRSLSDWPKT